MNLFKLEWQANLVSIRKNRQIVTFLIYIRNHDGKGI